LTGEGHWLTDAQDLVSELEKAQALWTLTRNVCPSEAYER